MDHLHGMNNEEDLLGANKKAPLRVGSLARLIQRVGTRQRLRAILEIHGTKMEVHGINKMILHVLQQVREMERAGLKVGMVPRRDEWGAKTTLVVIGGDPNRLMVVRGAGKVVKVGGSLMGILPW